MEEMKLSREFGLDLTANQTGYECQLEYGKLQIAAMPEMGYTAHQLLVAATAACGGIVFGMIAKKMRLNVMGVHIRADALRNPDEANRVEEIDLHYVVTGRDLRPGAVAQAIELAHKNCPVAQSIEGAIKVTETFEIIEG
ncbi:MAG: OsmC family protein [Chloroflexi bacterium]|nr:OsmC family protein [Chloroflexota bacterium]